MEKTESGNDVYHTLRCQILTAVFRYPNKVLKNEAVALHLADLRQPLKFIFISSWFYLTMLSPVISFG